MPTCGQAVAGHLETLGVTHVFGIPGNHTLELYRGLQGSSIRHVTTRHEQGAAFMADGYARASGRPGVCFLISGPGLLNAATAIAQANADSVPLLIVTAVAARADLGRRRGNLHELTDQRAAASGFAKSSLTIEQPEQLGPALDAAFQSFACERPGPVHIEIPLDVMSATAASHRHSESPQPRSFEEEQLAAIGSSLQRAERGLCIVGGGAVGAADDLPRLLEHFDLPLVNTVNGKGICPANHPLAVGGSPSLSSVRELVRDADTVLAIGTEFGETDYDLLMADPFTVPGELLRIDIDATQLTSNQQPDIGLCADAHAAVKRLLKMPGRAANTGPGRAAAAREALRSDPHYHPDMAALFDAIQSPNADLVLVGDSARPTYYAAWQYECMEPRRYFHSVTGFGTLGYAIPAAFGARLSGSRPVAALIGDGGAQFTLPELATAADNRIGVPIIIWMNRGYAEIENSLAGRGIETASATISGPDFEDVARAYGLPCETPVDLPALEAQLAAALERDVPTLLLLGQERFTNQSSGNWY